MKFRYHLSLPSRADDTILPAVLAGALALMFGVQLWLSGSDPELPPALAVGASQANTAVPAMTPVGADRIIFDRPLFAPRQSLTAASQAGPAYAIGGAIVAGTVAIRGRSFAVVRRPNGVVTNLGIGGSIDGWRLVALPSDGAVFVKNKERRVIPYGAAAVPVAEEDAPSE